MFTNRQGKDKSPVVNRGISKKLPRLHRKEYNPEADLDFVREKKECGWADHLFQNGWDRRGVVGRGGKGKGFNPRTRKGCLCGHRTGERVAEEGGFHWGGGGGGQG